MSFLCKHYRSTAQYLAEIERDRKGLLLPLTFSFFPPFFLSYFDEWYLDLLPISQAPPSDLSIDGSWRSVRSESACQAKSAKGVKVWGKNHKWRIKKTEDPFRLGLGSFSHCSVSRNTRQVCNQVCTKGTSTAVNLWWKWGFAHPSFRWGGKRIECQSQIALEVTAICLGFVVVLPHCSVVAKGKNERKTYLLDKAIGAFSEYLEK